MKHKTSELEGALLDAAVAKAEGCLAPYQGEWLPGMNLAYASDWGDGGPLIERERIAVYAERYPARTDEPWVAGYNLEVEQGHDWGGETGAEASTLSLDYSQAGPTPLIAAMRAYVASKFGDDVEIP